MTQFKGDVIRFGLLVGGLLIFLLLELVIPYKEKSVSKTRRWINNLSLGMINYVVLQFIFFTLIFKVADLVTQQQIGLIHITNLPRWLNIIDTILLMDFFLYLWHVLLHRLPLLWRFHRVHHTDLDLDVSSSARFHLFEIVLTAVVWMGTVYLIGADLIGVLIFESLYILADQFRHSSFRIPQLFEQVYWVLFVPPIMHRIHHSADIKERHTNFGTVFSIWDRFLGTLRTGVNPRDIWYGVDGHIQEKKLDLHHLLILPFRPPVK